MRTKRTFAGAAEKLPKNIRGGPDGRKAAVRHEPANTCFIDTRAEIL